MMQNEAIEIIKKMLLKSRSKLKTAQIDYDNGRYDDSVSRSYYAVYHCISAMLLSRGLHFSSHGETIGAFNKEFVKTKLLPASFTKTIKKLFNERHRGDYDFESSFSSDDAKFGMQGAEKIIVKCEKYLSKIYKVRTDYWI